MRGSARRRTTKRQPWPTVDAGRGAEAVRWQVWLGVQLQEWRSSTPYGGRRGLTQAEAARRVGIRQESLSRLESGRRRTDAYELVVFARAYRRSTADIAALFTPPTAEQWAAVREGRVDVAVYRVPPSGPASAPATHPASGRPVRP
jgi:hypothetical protein